MEYLNTDTSYIDPDQRPLEIVERKGIGHPDTLADALAEEISSAYSDYCLANFGVVLHHNLDKVYIGGGWFTNDFGKKEMNRPIRVVTNGRISNTMNGQSINVEEIQRDTIIRYLDRVLPHLNTSTELVIETNSTQHTKIPHWFSPRDIHDIPDATKVLANDTSVCVAHYPPTPCESLTLALEQYFWTDSGATKVPRFEQIGQDIKVMVTKCDTMIEATICMPAISTLTPSLEDYRLLNRKVEAELNVLANEVLAGTGYSSVVKVNPSVGTDPKMYMLAIGSCIECGEEGIVGRGNNNQGVISVFRPHSMEAPAGKNPRYHTGRVLGFLTNKLAKAIYDKLNVKCTIIALTKNGHSLVPPALLNISLSRPVSASELHEVIDTDFLSVDYLSQILSARTVR